MFVLFQATALLAQNIREKVESISLWQDVTSQTIRELNQAIQQMPNDVSPAFSVYSPLDVGMKHHFLSHCQSAR